MYDIIGDIHGYAGELRNLLELMGYQNQNGFYEHPVRRAIFVGDFIDRGPEIRETLHLIKNMHDNGSALAVLGNHEYKAICFHSQTLQGHYLRKHTKRAINKHQATLDAFKKYPNELQLFINWFKTIPVFLDLKDIRIVHACWHAKSIEFIKQKLPNNCLNDEFLLQAAKKNTPENQAVEILLEGININLPQSNFHITETGKIIEEIRIKWWKQFRKPTYKKLAVAQNWQITNLPVDYNDIKEIVGYSSLEKPVFVGHYWQKGTPEILTPNIACVDYSIAKDGVLTAYRWNGEKKLENKNFIYKKQTHNHLTTIIMIADRDFSQEFKFITARSGGPGGQYVNKTNSKVELRFDVENSILLSDEEKTVIFNKLNNLITKEAILQVVSQTHRSQLKNKKECVEKFYELIEEALKTSKKRKKTKIPNVINEKRLKEKKKKAEKKSIRTWRF